MKTDSRKLLVFCLFILVAAIRSIATTIVGWGSGPGTNVPPGITTALAIASGSSRNLALRADSTVVAWGNNSYSHTTVPESLSTVVPVSGGFYHSLALKSDGSMSPWGR